MCVCYIADERVRGAREARARGTLARPKLCERVDHLQLPFLGILVRRTRRADAERIISKRNCTRALRGSISGRHARGLISKNARRTCSASRAFKVRTTPYEGTGYKLKASPKKIIFLSLLVITVAPRNYPIQLGPAHRWRTQCPLATG